MEKVTVTASACLLPDREVLYPGSLMATFLVYTPRAEGQGIHLDFFQGTIKSLSLSRQREDGLCEDRLHGWT